MLKTKDNYIQVEYIKNLGDAPIHMADWSIVNISVDKRETEQFFSKLYNSPNDNHVSLVLCRHNKKKRIDALSNISLIGDYLKYLETICISYEKPSSCSNNGLLPIAETGYLFYRGILPDIKGTSWFREGSANATNMWDIGARNGESLKKTYFKRFSWELQLIMYSLSGNLKYRSFLYIAPISSDSEVEDIYNFCKTYNISCVLYIDDENMMGNINKIINKINTNG